VRVTGCPSFDPAEVAAGELAEAASAAEGAVLAPVLPLAAELLPDELEHALAAAAKQSAAATGAIARMRTRFMN